MKNLKLIFILLIASLTSVSCLVDDTDEVLETAATRPYVVGFKAKTANLSYFEDLGAIPTSFPVDLIGGFDGLPASTDLILNYQVNTAESTATEGVEFDFVNNSGSVTIPAGSNFATLDLLINTGNFNLEEPTVVVIDLISVTNGEAVVAAQNKSLTITFVGCQADLDQYTYDVTTIVIATGNLENQQEENITMTATNSFRTETVGPFGPGARRGSIGGEEGYDFDVICGAIVVPEQNLVNLYSNMVFGSGSVDPETGDITTTYTITFGAGPVVYRSIYVRQQ